MANTQSNDPRAIQTRQALQLAFVELLQVKNSQKITVTDVAKQAGYARHTFYNHYETLEDLLSGVVDSVLGGFFAELEKWDLSQDNAEDALRHTIASFFRALKNNHDTVKVLKYVDIDNLYIERLTAYFTKYYYDRVVLEMPGASISLAKYMISFNAYTLLGIVKPWLEDDMSYPPEAMADFLLQLTGGSAERRLVVERFKRFIR